MNQSYMDQQMMSHGGPPHGPTHGVPQHSGLPHSHGGPPHGPPGGGMRHGGMPVQSHMDVDDRDDGGKAAKEPKFGSWEEDAWQMIKLGQRQSVAFKEAWQRWCLDYSSGARPVFDPAKHPQDFIKAFLDAVGRSFLQYGPGGFGGKGGGGYDGGFGKGGYGGYGKGGGSYDTSYGSDYGGNMGKGMGKGAAPRLGPSPPASLVQLIKASQRIPKLRDAWAEYVEESGNRYNDPARQSSGFILGYVIHYGSDFVSADFFSPLASRLEVDGVMAVLRHIIKVGQKNDQGWKEAWQNFCDERNNGFRDPYRTDIKEVLLFLQSVASDYQDQHWYTTALG